MRLLILLAQKPEQTDAELLHRLWPHRKLTPIEIRGYLTPLRNMRRIGLIRTNAQDGVIRYSLDNYGHHACAQFRPWEYPVAGTFTATFPRDYQD